MNKNKRYKILNKQTFSCGRYHLVPIRYEDRMDIMGWRNEQIFHLRQSKPLTEKDQNHYFNNIVSELFNQEEPLQILFSYLEGDKCIGYGGLVHINWVNKNAEISFIMDTSLEESNFHFHWSTFLHMIEELAFKELKLHKIYTYAYDLRPHLYNVLELNNYKKVAQLEDHIYFHNKYVDVIIHEKRILQEELILRLAHPNDIKLLFDWANEKTVRINSINNEEIKWEDHLLWFENIIKSNHTKLFILENKGYPVGQIRLDYLADDKIWLINFSIDKKYRGQGFGKMIIEKAMNKISKGNFRALVKTDNIPSQKIFEYLNFSEETQVSKELKSYYFCAK